jgi:hypothetical protein
MAGSYLLSCNFTSSPGSSSTVSSLKLRDNSGAITLTAWGSISSELDSLQAPCAVAIKNVTVKSAKPGSGALYELVLANSNQSVQRYDGPPLRINLARPLHKEFFTVDKLGPLVNRVVNVLVSVRQRNALVQPTTTDGNARQTFKLADATGCIQMVCIQYVIQVICRTHIRTIP